MRAMRGLQGANSALRRALCTAAAAETKLVSLPQIQAARAVVDASPIVRRTPLVHVTNSKILGALPHAKNSDIFMKLESMQITGSFKARGMANVLESLPEAVRSGEQGMVTMSAGNFGRSFASAAKDSGIPAIVVMPDSAPVERAALIESLGARVERVPVTELKQRVDEHVKTGMYFAHPFDDLDLIAGHASAGLEILEDMSEDPDVIVVCCGGGGLLAGVASAVKLSGSRARVVGVEPEGAPSMHKSVKQGSAATLQGVDTIAAGLAPPFAGEHCYRHVREYVDECLLVSDQELREGMRYLFQDLSVAAEPSGAAAVAALLSNKLGDVSGQRVVVMVSGGNVEREEFNRLLQRDDEKK